MTNLLTYYSYAGTSIALTIVPFIIIWRRQGKQQLQLGFGKLFFVFLAIFFGCFASFAFLMLVTELSGYQNLDAFVQPFGIASSFVGYFAGDKLFIWISRQAASK